MLPATLSASSVHVAELCMSRWTVEMFEKSSRFSNDSALLGTSVHGALENYVREVFLKNTVTPSMSVLEMFYISSYMETFGTSDTDTDAYRDGLGLLKSWYKRSDHLSGVEILSAEKKETFDLKTSSGVIPFTYIFDRLDKLEDDVYRVVDYKSSMWNVTPEDLKKKLQPRVYALAVNIMFPNARRIFVEFDMLRYDRVGRLFSREENIATWKYLVANAERIIQTSHTEGLAAETLNDECRFCIKKTTCKAVESNANAGGIMALDLEGMIDKLGLLQAQKRAIDAAAVELESMIVADSKERNWFTMETDQSSASFSSRKRRSIDPEQVAKLVPLPVWQKYGSFSMTLKNFEMMIGDPLISAELAAELRGMIFNGTTQPSLKIKPKVGIEDED